MPPAGGSNRLRRLRYSCPIAGKEARCCRRPTAAKRCCERPEGSRASSPSEAVVRRWVSPVSGTLSIEGTLRHGQPAVPYGDGVRGRIVSSRHGELASWSVNGSSAETKLSGIKIEKGDTIDFVVDARTDPENDAFSWSPVDQVRRPTPGMRRTISPVRGRSRFRCWARYAQVLLETNEFSFVD